MRWAIIIAVSIIFCSLLFRFRPRGSDKIYSLVIAHRGLHLFQPENTLAAYKAARDANMAIELDVRMTQDGRLVCFHDRFTKRLLNIPGKLSMFTLTDIKKYKVMGSKERVPTLNQALNVIGGNVSILIEVKGNLNKEYLEQLVQVKKRYKADVFFHTKNIFNYFRLRKAFDKNDSHEKTVYCVLNIFRARFNFVKGSDYSSEISKYNELSSNLDVEIPSIEDISSIIVRSIERLEDKKEILATIGSVINKYETRVSPKDKSHWVNNSLWLHRGIVSSKYPEHSYEGFNACKKYAKTNNISMTVEFDVMLYKGEIRCYHRDRLPSLIGQDKSCAEKLKLSNSLKLKQVLEIFNGCPNINLAIDIKDYHFKNRLLEELIIKEIEDINYSGNFIVMSFNPFVLKYFKEKKPEWLRAQIGNSLKSLRKVPIFRFPWILNGILGMLFDMSCADCIVLDNSKWIYYLIAYHKNIKGKPVLIYAPKTFVEQEAFIGRASVSNFIIENVKDQTAWPKGYLSKFKRN